MSDVTLTWLGHSCWMLEKDDYRIVLDPYLDGSVPGYAPLRVEADRVICSHEHADHGGPDHGRGVVTIREGADKKDCPWEITELHSFHDEHGGADRGENMIRIFSDGRYRIAHMGDLGTAPDKEQEEVLRNLDVMLVPVGGVYTLEPADIRKVVERLEPQVCIPMHYYDGKRGYPVTGPLSAYTDLCDDVVEYEDNIFYLPEDGFPQTAVLRYMEK